MSTLLTINNYHYRRGGADVACMEQSELFMRHGWRVASFSMVHGNNLPSPWSAYFVDEIEHGHHYPWYRVLVNATKSIYSWESISKIRSLIRDVRPDIAHAHNIYHHISPSILGALKSEGIPLFMTLHDVKLLCPARTMWSNGEVCEACKGGQLRNVVLRKCMKGSLALSSLIYLESSIHRLLQSYGKNVDRFISPSRFVLEKFKEWGWPVDQLVHIPNFVNVEQYLPNYAPGRAFLYFGRLSEEKGVATLIRASAAAGVPLCLVGTGPEQGALQALANTLSADVTFHGFKSGESLWDLVRSARAVVLPSEWYENAPLSILEAFALGKPVVGARIGGIPEMVIEDQTGWLFESGNSNDLADVLARVVRLPDASVAEFGFRARALVAEEYSSQKHYERLSALYGNFMRTENLVAPFSVADTRDRGDENG